MKENIIRLALIFPTDLRIHVSFSDFLSLALSQPVSFRLPYVLVPSVMPSFSSSISFSLVTSSQPTTHSGSSSPPNPSPPHCFSPPPAAPDTTLFQPDLLAASPAAPSFPMPSFSKYSLPFAPLHYGNCSPKYRNYLIAKLNDLSSPFILLDPCNTFDTGDPFFLFETTFLGSVSQLIHIMSGHFLYLELESTVVLAGLDDTQRLCLYRVLRALV